MSSPRALMPRDLAAAPSCPTFWQAIWPTLLVGAVLFVVLDGYWRHMGVYATRSDVGYYVRWSEMLDRPLEWHDWDKYLRLPLFMVLIAGVRAVTPDAISAGAVCQCIIIAAWVASLFWTAGAVRKIWPTGTRLGVLAWGVFPITGFVYVAYPVADVLGLSFFAAALYAGVCGRWWWYVAATNLALVAHKAVWPVLFLMTLVFMLQHGMRWWHFVACGGLLTAYYLFGRTTFATDDPLWLVSGNKKYHLTANSAWSLFGIPVFDGFRTSLAEGGITALAKGIIYPLAFGTAAVLGVDAGRRRDWLSLMLVIPTLVYCVVLNRLELWAVMRFAHPMVFAAAASLAARPHWTRVLTTRTTFGLAAVTLVASELLWGLGRMASNGLD